MKVLIIGGTQFIGKHTTQVLLARNHEVTHFNRGKSNADAFPDIETVIGDRDTDLDRLSGRKFDWILDMCGYTRQSVIKSAERHDLADRYCYVSTISVYGKPSPDVVVEDTPVGQIENEDTEVVDAETYGPLKAVCEREVAERWGDRAFLPRPAAVAGPDDPTDRFTYWVRRFSTGRDVLVPTPPDGHRQFVDVRDLAEFVVHGMESNYSGPYTVINRDVTMADIVRACQREIANAGDAVWVDSDWLAEQGLAHWSDLPLWLPTKRPFFDPSKAIAAGLKQRPIETTVRDTYEWMKRLPQDHKWDAGISDERETELLTAWGNRDL